MRKTDKKLEKAIVAGLTDACEDALKLYDGFQWLTHIVNFQTFPESLLIVCVFDTQENLLKTIESDNASHFKTSIEKRLLSNNIQVKDIKKRILFDTEQACENEHHGNWSKRLERLKK